MAYYRETADYHAESSGDWYPKGTPKEAIKENNLSKRNAEKTKRQGNAKQ